MPSWTESPTLDLDWSLPIGQRLRAATPAMVAAGKELLASMLSMIPPAARFLADVVRVRTLGRFHHEAKAVAEFSGAQWRQVMLANLSYDLVIGSMGCSTIALATKQGPVLARNMDWWPEDLLAKATVRLRAIRNGQVQYASAGFPGSLGIATGLSGRGFAVALNAVVAPEKCSFRGYPVLLHLRRVVEDAKDFGHALEMLSSQRLTTPALFTLVGTKNHERVVIERTPSRFALRRPQNDDEALVATNDYRLLFPPTSSHLNELYETTCGRWEALTHFFRHHHSERVVEDDELLYRLTDPLVRQGITAQHVIMRPYERSIRVLTPTHLLV